MNEQYTDITPENKPDELLSELKEIRKNLERANSFSRKLLLGILTGFGTVIGATIVVTVVVYILSLLSEFGVLTSFNDWIISNIKN